MSSDGCGRRLLGARCMLGEHMDDKHQFQISESTISSLEAGVRKGMAEDAERRDSLRAEAIRQDSLHGRKADA